MGWVRFDDPTFRLRSPPMSVMPMPMVTPSPMTMVPAVAPTPVMMMPVHLGGELLRVLLHRLRGTGTNQRYRACTLNWCCHGEKRANSCQAQNFRSVQLNLLKIFGYSLAPHRRSSVRSDARKT